MIPAAMELQVGAAEAKAMNCRVVVEAANGPTDLDGEAILLSRGIQLLPDILVNSGGVVVSYFEWLQNKRGEQWDITDVRSRLETRMNSTYRAAADKAHQLKVDMRTACYALALDRLVQVYTRRGIWP